MFFAANTDEIPTKCPSSPRLSYVRFHLRNQVPKCTGTTRLKASCSWSASVQRHVSFSRMSAIRKRWASRWNGVRRRLGDADWCALTRTGDGVLPRPSQVAFRCAQVRCPTAVRDPSEGLDAPAAARDQQISSGGPPSITCQRYTKPSIDAFRPAMETTCSEPRRRAG